MASPRKKRTKKLSAPANEDEVSQYYAACRVADIEPADTLRKLAAGVVEHVAAHKSFTFPVRFCSGSKKGS